MNHSDLIMSDMTEVDKEFYLYLKSLNFKHKSLLEIYRIVERDLGPRLDRYIDECFESDRINRNYLLIKAKSFYDTISGFDNLLKSL